MRTSLRLLQHSVRVILFSRGNCSLCDSAKALLGNVEQQRHFDRFDIDVMENGQEQWKHAYEFDTPVVSAFKLSILHV